MSIDESIVADFVGMDPHDLKVGPPFSDLLPISPSVLDAVTESMRVIGYDHSKPINVWRQTGLVLDGHTRRRAAINAGIPEVLICFHDFDSEDAAFEYAVANQRDRRNLTDSDVLRLVALLDQRRQKGGDRKSAEAKKSIPTGVGIDRVDTAEQTAKLIGTNRGKVEKARAINDFAEKEGDTSVRDDVLSGKTSINAGSRTVSDKKKKKAREVKPQVVSPVKPRQEQLVNEAQAMPRTQEDEEWLNSFPIRHQVVTHRFDEDAMIYRALEPLFLKAKEEMQSVGGDRSFTMMGIYRRAVHRVSDMSPVHCWIVCKKCQGTGTTTSICQSCHGGGYVIP